MRRIFLIAVSVLIFLFSGRLYAQDGSENNKASISSYFDAVAKTLYKFAWPTATYRSWSLDGISPIDHGIEVSVRLVGTSAFDGGDLWLKLAADFTNGHFQRFRVVNHNAVLMPPFETAQLVAGASAYLADQYAAQNTQQQTATPQTSDSSLTDVQEDPNLPVIQPTPTVPPLPDGDPAEGVCVINTTRYDLTFQYKLVSWQQTTVHAGNSILIAVPKPDKTSRPDIVTVSYLDGATTNAAPKNFDLPSGAITTNSTCKDAPNFHFAFDNNNSLVLYAGPPNQ